MSTLLDLLQNLQKVDLEISSIENESTGYREQIEILSAEIENLEEETESLTATVESAEATVKEVEETIRESSDKIKKGENTTAGITTDKAFKAQAREVSGAKKNVKAAKERLDRLVPEAEEQRAKLDEKLAVIEAKNVEIQSLSEEMEEKSKGWESVLTEKKGERETVASEIDPSLLKRYETIRERRRGVGLVEVKREVCQGCFMNLPPQLYIKLMRGDEELLSCPNCHRILYCIRDTPKAEGE